MSKLYTKDSIESLSPLEFTRLRPQVYAGDTTYATQLLVEILSNSIDEYRLGHGNQIDISIEGDKIRVRDYGQGFLVNEIREDGKTVLEEMFEKPRMPKEIVKEKGLLQISDEGEIKKIVDDVLTKNPQSIIDYKNGKDRALGFLVGQAMKETHGKANPKLLNKLFLEGLNNSNN